MKLTGEAEIESFGSISRLDLTLVCTPKEGAGETAEALRRPDSAFQHVLATTDRQKKFLMFLVRPDSIDVFGAARDTAVAMQFSTGWSPQVVDQPIRLSLTGGRRPKEL